MSGGDEESLRAADAPRRPAAPFSVALDRDLFAGSQNLLTSRSRSFEFDSLLHICTKKEPLRTLFCAMVEMRRVELLSESISTGLSPSAAGDLVFALLPAHQQADKSAIP